MHPSSHIREIPCFIFLPPFFIIPHISYPGMLHLTHLIIRHTNLCLPHYKTDRLITNQGALSEQVTEVINIDIG